LEILCGPDLEDGGAVYGCWCPEGPLIALWLVVCVFQINRDRQSVGRRYVEITPGTRADYYEAIAAVRQGKPSSGASMCGAHLRSLSVFMYVPFTIAATNEGTAAAAVFEGRGRQARGSTGYSLAAARYVGRLCHVGRIRSRP
jgi:hypothetical protein